MSRKQIVRGALPLFLALVTLLAGTSHSRAQGDDTAAQTSHVVQAGDTWAALALRYDVSRQALQAANPHPNPARQPAIGDTITVPAPAERERRGALVRSGDGGLLRTALRYNVNVWQLALENGLPHPYRPLFQRPIFVSGGERPPRDYPQGFSDLELSQVPAQPGQALAFRARARGAGVITATLGSASFDSFVNGDHVVGLGGTGAFFQAGAPELSIRSDDGWLWSQPWRLVPGTWEFDEITLTGAAAEIDQEAIAAERERMFQIWSQVTPEPQWTGPFRLPIDTFLSVSSTYGARRSYNGGPYSSYHEGVDFSAYEGTPVYASGAGTVVLAEMLYVRGGAVVIDHGLGIYSGTYHMSAVHAQPGQIVRPGDLVGEVGTTGLSSGNHLHWDLLVAQTWVDAAAWHEQNMACWILEGWGTGCRDQPQE
jgi:murein DD-endopeptidase MepM/ murein hydrolase activator NlpD